MHGICIHGAGVFADAELFLYEKVFSHALFATFSLEGLHHKGELITVLHSYYSLFLYISKAFCLFLYPYQPFPCYHETWNRK